MDEPRIASDDPVMEQPGLSAGAYEAVNAIRDLLDGESRLVPARRTVERSGRSRDF